MRSIARLTLRLTLRFATLALVAPAALLTACQDDGPLAAEPPDTKKSGLASGDGPAYVVGSPCGAQYCPQSPGRIVFANASGATSNVYTMDASGGTPQQLTVDGASRSPARSPDYKRVAYVSTSGLGGGGVWVMNADGSAKTQVAQAGAFADHPRWSPDGARLVFSTRAVGASDNDVYVVNANGTGLKRLTSETSDEVDPTFTPDGTKIVFASTRATQTYNYDLWSMSTDGMALSRLTMTSDNERYPAFASGAASGAKLVCVAIGASRKLIVGDGYGLLYTQTPHGVATGGGPSAARTCDELPSLLPDYRGTGRGTDGCLTYRAPPSTASRTSSWGRPSSTTA
jgi:hypothetical protein